MHIIEPLVNHGQYVEDHERWYLLPLPRARELPLFGNTLFFPINTGVAHERFVQKWARQERRDDARTRRDAREQFLARMEAI